MIKDFLDGKLSIKAKLKSGEIIDVVAIENNGRISYENEQYKTASGFVIMYENMKRLTVAEQGSYEIVEIEAIDG